MNDNDKELISKIATDVMGWPKAEIDDNYPVAYSDEGGDVKVRWPVAQENRDGGWDSVIWWRTWNPLEDPADWCAVINKLGTNGLHVILNFKRTLCSISTEEGAVLGRCIADTIGKAICTAALEAVEEARIINTVIAMAKSRQELHFDPQITYKPSDWSPDGTGDHTTL